MGLEDVIRAIVPLSFLAIWALTSMFNRDAKPLPPRPGFGPGAGGPPPPRPTLPPPELAREMKMRFGQLNQTSDGMTSPAIQARRPAAVIGGDDLLIIRPESPRPQPKPGAPQRRTRSKPAAAAKSQPVEAELLGGSLGSNVSQQMQPIDLTRTNTPFIAVGNLSNTTTAASVAYGERSQGLTDVRIALMDPLRIREALIMNEILQPPMSLRRKQGRG